MLAWEMATVVCVRRRIRPGIELESDQEHVEDHAHLGEDRQEGRDLGRQDEGGDLRRHPPQQGRPQQDPGDHLSDHRRLAESRKHGAHEPGGENHQNHRAQDVHQGVEAKLRRTGRKGLLARGRSGQVLPQPADREESADGERQHGQVDQRRLPGQRPPDGVRLGTHSVHRSTFPGSKARPTREEWRVSSSRSRPTAMAHRKTPHVRLRRRSVEP